jgi:multidrug resistance efflux pump
VVEVEALRENLATAQQENRELRAELDEGVDILRGAEAALAGSAPPAGRRPRGGRGDAVASPGRRRARTTPASVTADVVRTVIGRLGRATAAEIAEEISRGGTPVSGRAIRHIARAAGAVARPGDGGAMVYTLG